MNVSERLRRGCGRERASCGLQFAPAWFMVANVSKPAARVGILAVLVGAIAVAAGYVNNCFTSFGLGAGAGQVAVKPDDAAAPAAATVKTSVVVQGEHCQHFGATQKCEDLCKSIEASAVDVEATNGAQGTVDTFKGCLQGRGIKVQIQSE